MTCKNCIGYEYCNPQPRNYRNAEKRCKNFKNKADFVEVRDCEKCKHFNKHAMQYPCSHCRNCYTDKFELDRERTILRSDTNER